VLKLKDIFPNSKYKNIKFFRALIFSKLFFGRCSTAKLIYTKVIWKSPHILDG